MKKKILLYIFGGIAAYLLLTGASALILGLFGGGGKLAFLFGGILEAIILLIVFFDFRLRGSKRVLKVNVDLENSHFLTDKELRNNSGFTVTTLGNLHEVKDGVLLRAEKRGENINVVLKDPIHTLVIGATGTGKTSAYISPSIEVLCRTATKPSLVITDPKGELYAMHAASLKREGYTVGVIDLADAFHSTRWNPLGEIIAKTDQLKVLRVEPKNGKYYVAGREFATMLAAERGVREITAELENEIYIDLQDLIYTMCPIESKNEPVWEQAARNFIFGIMLAFWEDLRDGFMENDEFTLYNLYKTISDYATDECRELKYYVSTRRSDSRVKGLTNTVLVSQDRTLASYLGSVQAYVTWLADSGITALTSASDIGFEKFDENPNALFLKIPDEKENRYKLVTVFATQMYKSLVYKATMNARNGVTEGQTLLRNTYFLLDEFGNMPRFYNLDKIVTVGRSRGIFLVPVIQDFNQLENKYGRDVAAIVRSNCNVQVFIGTNDENTRKTFSEQCGKRRVKQISYNENRDMSVSTGAQTVPLIYPSDLERLNDPANGVFGNLVILNLGNYPMRSVVTPFFKVKELYGARETALTHGEFIDPQAVENPYDILVAARFIADALPAPVPNAPQNAPGSTAPPTDVAAKPPAAEPSDMREDLLREQLERLEGRIAHEMYEKLLRAETDGARRTVLDELIETAASPFLLADLIKIRQNLDRRQSREERT